MKLPSGWRDRLVAYESPATNGVTAYCLEVHDLWLSKAVAGRPKDRDFCNAVFASGLVDLAVLRSRLDQMDEVDDEIRDHVRGLLEKLERSGKR